MIDVHSHILPAVDDGVESMEEALAVIEDSHEKGVQAIVATPHFMEEAYRPSLDEIKKLVSILQTEVDNLGLDFRIYPGAEVYIYPELARDLSQGLIPTLNDSKYLLLELPMSKIPSYTEKLFYDVKALGYLPIIAHPERCMDIMEDPNLLYNWVSEGIYAQLNAGSLLGYFDEKVKESAEILLEHNLLHLIGSDLHSLEKRGQCLNKALAILEKNNGEWAELFIKNSQLIIENKGLDLLPAKTYQKKS